MGFDIVAWQIDGHTLVMAGTERGGHFLEALPNIIVGRGEGLFQDFLDIIPSELEIGVLCPNGQICKYITSGVLH